MRALELDFSADVMIVGHDAISKMRIEDKKKLLFGDFDDAIDIIGEIASHRLVFIAALLINLRLTLLGIFQSYTSTIRLLTAPSLRNDDLLHFADFFYFGPPMLCIPSHYPSPLLRSYEHIEFYVLPDINYTSRCLPVEHVAVPRDAQITALRYVYERGSI